MKNIEFTKEELSQLIRAKKELLFDKDATFTSQSKNNQLIFDISVKYGVDNQFIYDSIPVRLIDRYTQHKNNK